MRRSATGPGFFAERKHVTKIPFQLDPGNECSLALPAVNDSSLAQGLDCLPHGHLTYAHADGNLLNRWHRFTWLEHSRLDLLKQMLLYLVVKRDAIPAIQACVVLWLLLFHQSS
jgi:hypothetical protein